HQGYSHGQIKAESVGRLERDLHSAIEENQERHRKGTGPQQSQFFSNDREDEITVGLGKKKELLLAGSQPQSPRPAATHRTQRLRYLPACAQGVVKRIQERLDAVPAERDSDYSEVSHGNREQDGDGNVFPVQPCHE